MRDLIPSPCPLCAGSAQGGRLCTRCYRDVMGWPPASFSALEIDDLHQPEAHQLRRAHRGDLLATAPARDITQRCLRCALRFSANHQFCADCTAREPAFAYTIAAFDYIPPFDTLVLQVKQARRFGLAVTLGGLLVDAVLRDSRGLPPETRLVPVPSTRAALRHRGFNPAGEVARSVGGQLGLPVLRGVLALHEDGLGSQRTLSRRERLQRAENRFQVRPGQGHRVKGQTIAVVDDVMTTGSTVHSAARALLDAGAHRVIALAVARTPATRA